MFGRFACYLCALLTGRLDRWEDPEFRDLLAYGREADRQAGPARSLEPSDRLREIAEQQEKRVAALRDAAARREASGDRRMAKRLRIEAEAHADALERLRVSQRELDQLRKEILAGDLSTFSHLRSSGLGRNGPFRVSPKPDEAIPLSYRGRNERGIPMYDGSRHGFLNADGVAIMLVGWTGLIALAKSEAILLYVIALEVGLVMLALYRRRQRMRLCSIDELAEQLSAPELTCLLLARERGIEPRCIINGREYFDLKDFGEAAILLRAAAEPAEPDGSLLRPAAGSEVDPASLLRPAPPD